MKNYFKWLVLFLVAFDVLSCGGTSDSLGGTEAGNPPSATTRNLTGQIVSGSGSVTSSFATSGVCPADDIIATNSLTEQISSSVDSDCNFTLALPVNTAYSIYFELNGSRVASMVFSNGAALPESYVFVLSDGDSNVDVGIVTINGVAAYPEVEPSTENDQDDDGVSDYDDNDDNDDGVNDDQEADCDEDGYLNSYDEDESTCLDGGSETEDDLEIED